LITQIGNKVVETSVPEFSGILPEFPTNQNFGVRLQPLHTRLLHHWFKTMVINLCAARDSRCEIVLK